MTILKEIINKNNKKKLFIFPNKKYLSYKQFYNQALNFAKNYESRLNKTKNKTVFLRMNRSIDFYIAVIGLAFLKAIIIPISIEFRLQFRLQVQLQFQLQFLFDKLIFWVFIKTGR